MSGSPWEEFEYEPGRAEIVPATFYFLHAAQWIESDGSTRFASALRIQGPEDPTTSIDRLELAEFPKNLHPFVVHTYTEYVDRVWAGDAWHNEYIRPSHFTAFFWPEEDLVIANASRQVVEQFIRAAREKSLGKVSLQLHDVDLEAAARETPRAKRIRLERDPDLGAGSFVDTLIVGGRDVEQANEVLSYRASGGRGTGLQFAYGMTDWPDLDVAISSDGSIRLMRHIGARTQPNTAMELQFVIEIWRAFVAKHARIHEIRRPGAPVRSRRPRTLPTAKSRTPGPIEGQEPFDGLLEP